MIMMGFVVGREQATRVIGVRTAKRQIIIPENPGVKEWEARGVITRHLHHTPLQRHRRQRQHQHLHLRLRLPQLRPDKLNSLSS